MTEDDSERFTDPEHHRQASDRVKSDTQILYTSILILKLTYASIKI